MGGVGGGIWLGWCGGGGSINLFFKYASLDIFLSSFLLSYFFNHQSVYGTKSPANRAHGINNFVRKSVKLNPEESVKITAGVSAQGSGQPPIFEAIKPETKIGKGESFNFIDNSRHIKVNNRITLKLFMKSEVKYMTKGKKIYINVFLPLEISRNLSPIYLKNELFSNVLENSPKARISMIISSGKFERTSDKVKVLVRVPYINITPNPMLVIAVRYLTEKIIAIYTIKATIIANVILSLLNFFLGYF